MPMFCRTPTALLAILLVAPTVAALDVNETRHLLDRAGFGADPDRLEALNTLDRAAAIDALLRPTQDSIELPDWSGDRPFMDQSAFEGLDEAERQTLRQARNREIQARRRDLKAWWYRQMLTSEAPLLERMTLFWHDHFSTELRQVGSPQLMLQQHLTLRQHALGNYAELLRAMATDPAMLIYLDGRRNHRAKPNENFARELLELFTLGEGQYEEADIQAAARALSGWTLDPVSGAARFRPARHDDGRKTFLDRTGHFGLDAVLAILLEQPRTAEFIVEKLWRELISPEPDPNEVVRLAAGFREGGYAIRPLLREMLLSEAFWDDANRGSLVKSPVELIVGTIRRFDLPTPHDRELLALGQRMGQNLFDPPDVAGWPGHTAWIDANRLLMREQFLRRATRDLADESALAGQPWAGLDEEVVRQWLWPVQGVPVLAAPLPDDDGELGVREALIEAILDPRYQLK